MRTAAVFVALCFMPICARSAELRNALTAPAAGKLTTLGFQIERDPNGTFVYRTVPVPARGRFRSIRISSDGRFLFAQDHLGITVLGVQPFSILFRVPVEDARFARFTPDSQELVFVSPPGQSDDSHVERWRLKDGSRVGFFKVPMFDCESADLSPDGRVLICVSPDGTLRLTDVASRETMFERRNFGRQYYGFFGNSTYTFPLGTIGSAGIFLSPDARFVLVQNWSRSWAWDFRQNRELPVPGILRRSRNHNWAFIAADRILLQQSWSARHGLVRGGIVEFPSGKVLSKAKIPPGPFYTAADPEFVLFPVFGHEPERAAAMNFVTGKVIISDFPGLDAFGHFYVAESAVGEVGLYEIGKGLQAKISLPYD